MLKISFRSAFLHLLSLRFKAFTCFLKAFSFGDHHGVYLVFGKNWGKHFLLISPSSLQIVVIDLSSCSFVVTLLTRSVHYCLFC